METDDDFTRRAFAAHVAQDIGGSARTVVGFVDLAIERAREVGLSGLLTDFEKVRSAAANLTRLLNDFIETRLDTGADEDADVISRIRHDLRTPLNAIIGYSELIVEELEDTSHEALKGDLAHVRAEADDLLAKIDAIVDMRIAGARTADPAASAAADMATSLATAMGREPHDHRTGPGRILIIDDVASNRELLSRRLDRDGHTTLMAGSGAEGLALLAEHDVDVVLLDVLMPGMNGIEVLSRIKSNSAWEHLPVIIISGLTEMEAVIRCISAGADDYLSKPFNPVLLTARLQACLERKRWADREQRYLRRIESEKERADALLHAVLPGQVVARLNDGEAVIADRFDSVTILFADLVDFTSVAARTQPRDLVRRLDRIFCAFDDLAASIGVEKIKTIGDAYMAASGIPEVSFDHAERVMRLAEAMLQTVKAVDPGETPFELRIGIHTGPVVAGLLGNHRFVYDVWGETVNIASRLESHGVPGQIQLSEATRRVLTRTRDLRPRGKIDLKGVGRVDAYLFSIP